MFKSNNLTKIRILSVVAYCLMIFVNALAIMLPLGGKTTKELSDMYPNLFVPAPITFAIWSVIYLFLLFYVVYQTGIFSNNSSTLTGKISEMGWLFILSCGLNATWIVAWQYQQVLISVIIMAIFLINLIMLYLKTRTDKKASLKKKLFLSIPFSIYLGWISVATIANVTALLVSLKWNGFGINPQIWTVVMIAIATVLAILFLQKHKDYFYALVIFWAVTGILINHSTILTYKYPVIMGTSAASLLVIFLFMLYTATKKEKRKVKHA